MKVWRVGFRGYPDCYYAAEKRNEARYMAVKEIQHARSDKYYTYIDAKAYRVPELDRYVKERCYIPQGQQLIELLEQFHNTAKEGDVALIEYRNYKWSIVND